MIPVVLGIIASSDRKIVSSSFTVYNACVGGYPFTVYTELGGTLQLDTIVYSDSNLTTLYADASFVDGGNQFATDSTGMIVTVDPCPDYTSYYVFYDCSQSDGISVYVQLGDPLQTGTTVYTTQDLNIEYANQTFVYENDTYTTDGSGIIDTVAVCYSQYTTYDDCAQSNETTLYSTYGIPTLLNNTVYYDSNLSTAAANIASFVYGSNIYRTNASGVVLLPASGPTSCPNAFTIYDDCANTTATTVYSVSGSIVNGTIIFTNINLTTPYVGSFVYNGEQYEANGSGVVSYITSCPTIYSYSVYDNCDNSNATTVYSYSSSISEGAELYTDDSLTTTFEGQFVYNSDVWTATNGYVTYNQPCSREWITYATCNEERDGGTPTNYYTAYADSTLQVNVTLYTDSSLTTSITASQFIYSGIVYNLTNGVITSFTSCIYSLTYNPYNCGASDSNTLYTPSNQISNAGLLANNAVLYTSEFLDTSINNATVYRYGYSTFITTNGGGVVDTEVSCPT